VNDRDKLVELMTSLMAAIVQTVQEAGPQGAPGPIIYLALMEQGISYAQYSQIMAKLVEVGTLTVRNHMYYFNDLRQVVQ